MTKRQRVEKSASFDGNLQKAEAIGQCDEGIAMEGSWIAHQTTARKASMFSISERRRRSGNTTVNEYETGNVRPNIVRHGETYASRAAFPKGGLCDKTANPPDGPNNFLGLLCLVGTSSSTYNPAPHSTSLYEPSGKIAPWLLRR